MAIKLWKFLTTDIRELNLGQGVEVVKTGTEAAKAVLDLAKAVKEQKTLNPYIGEISSLLDILNSPLGQIAGTVIPFAPIALTIIKLIADQTQKELSLVQCVALVSQAAYLESFRAILNDKPELLQRIGETPASDAVARQIKKLGEQELEEREAKKAILYFHESQLAAAFNEVLQQRLQEAGLAETEAKTLTEQVARKTDEYLLLELVKVGDKVKQLVDWYSTGGKQQIEKYLSIEDYLEQQIKPKPNENIFKENNITFRDLYVPLQVRPVDDSGKPVGDETPQIEEWVIKKLTEEQKQPKVIFIQGEAGRGKSVFSRMFADRVRQELHPNFTPILIRLRDLRVLANNLTETLENNLETVDFVQSDSGWLTDKKTRFLFLLDGFDELLLEGRTSGGLQEFLQQVENFQHNSHHRFLVTGRPLALQGIERLLSQRSLERVQIQPMDDSIRQTWLEKWAAKVGTQEKTDFEQFLQSCPDEIKENLAREPLLLYLLAKMHREKHFNAQMFAGAKGITAKIRIYDESIKWVLEEQRQDENLRLSGLESDDLRQFLTEVALCVVQSGNESANIKMLEARIKDSNDPIAKLIQQAREQTSLEKVKEEKVLNNLLTAFYIKPASGKNGGSMEFVHKSFGEFLFAERLVESFLDWTTQLTKRNRQENSVSTEVMDKQIYDLLGYGNLTPDIVEYLRGLLAECSEFEQPQRWLTLFQRLENFYLRWCDGEFIDAPPEKEILPLFKKEQLKKQLPERENHLGLRQVDVYTGLNVLILLLELHRYAQKRDDLKNEINFYPCGQPDTEEFDRGRLLCIIGYSQCLGAYTYNEILRLFLSGANLSGANLSGANLSGADLSDANLSRADLSGAYLSRADLSGADLSGAYLSSANLSRADLSGADLSDANLSSANLMFADLSDADLNRANLNRANLSLANLSRAYLSSANLSSANLSRANLSRANLSGANLSRANLSRADLSGANLSDAYLSDAYLEAAKWDSDTKWVNALGLHEAVSVSSELAQQPTFSAAAALSRGISLVIEGKVEEAIQAYNQALSLDPNLQVSAQSWYSLCWHGSLHDHAANVLYACENAVALEPDNKGFYQDSRGLARALTGDLLGALADFQAAVDSNALDDHSEDVKQRRLRWIEALKAGENPFTPEELEALREAEG
ncbi:pentapeptide repeat-containing protein [Cylindrospermum sp. NIES-4074]|nr:pentapeptide repeat-containing protein [Cylindrospermum sp. NIES-4074]